MNRCTGGNFYRYESIKRPRMWMRVTKVKVKGWGGRSRGENTHVAGLEGVVGCANREKGGVEG